MKQYDKGVSIFYYIIVLTYNIYYIVLYYNTIKKERYKIIDLNFHIKRQKNKIKPKVKLKE